MGDVDETMSRAKFVEELRQFAISHRLSGAPRTAALLDEAADLIESFTSAALKAQSDAT